MLFIFQNLFTSDSWLEIKLEKSIDSWIAIYGMVLSTKNNYEQRTLIIKLIYILQIKSPYILKKIGARLLPIFFRGFVEIVSDFINLRVISDKNKDDTNVDILAEQSLALLWLFISQHDLHLELSPMVSILTMASVLLSTTAKNNWNSLTISIDEIENEEEEEEKENQLRSIAIRVLSVLIDRFEDEVIENLIDCFSYFENGDLSKLKLLHASNINLKINGTKIKIDFTSLVDCFYKIYKSALLCGKELVIFLSTRFAQDIIAYLQLNKKFEPSYQIKLILQALSLEQPLFLISTGVLGLQVLRYLHEIDSDIILEFYELIIKILAAKLSSDLLLISMRGLAILNFRVMLIKKKEEAGKIISCYPSLISNMFNLIYTSPNMYFIHFLDCLIAICNFNSQCLATLANETIIKFLIKQMTTYKKNSSLKPYFTSIFISLLLSKESSAMLSNKLSIRILQLLSWNPEKWESDERDEEIILILSIISTSLRKGLNHLFISSFIFDLNNLILNSESALLINSFDQLLKELIVNQCSNKEIVLLAYQTLVKLSIPSNSEAQATHIGSLALALYQLKAEYRNSQFIEMIIRKLDRCALPSVVQGIIIFFSVIIEQNGEDIIVFLSDFHFLGKIGLKLLLDKWIMHQPKFIGPRVKEITLKGLSSIFCFKLPILEYLFVLGSKPSHKTHCPDLPVRQRVLIFFCHALDHEKRLSEKKERNCDRNTEQNVLQVISEYEDGRIETEADEFNDDFDIDLKVNFSDQEDENNLFPNQNQKGGLAAMETASQSYLSGLIGFDDLDNDELDESLEHQLSVIFKTPVLQITTILENLILKMKSSQFFTPNKASLQSRDQLLLDTLFY